MTTNSPQAPTWNSTMDSLFPDSRRKEVIDCELNINADGSISVAWLYGQNQQQGYTGFAVGDGHFDLTANGGVNRMTLHRSPNSRRFDGRCVEDGDESMITIFLGE